MEPKEKIIKILDAFGMSGVRASEAMNIKPQTFRSKKNDIPGHSFNEKNYQDLVDFIKKEAQKL